MVKRVIIVIIFALLGSLFVGQMSLAQYGLSLGGGMVASLPQIVGEYRWESFGFRAGFGVKDSETVFSTGGLYYIDFWEDLAAEPYFGGGLLLSSSKSSVPSPPPPPDSNSSLASTRDEQGGLETAFFLNGGLEVSFPSLQLPVSLWGGIAHVPGSKNQNPAGSGVSVGVKVKF